MTTRRHSMTASAFGLAACLLLAACSSSATQAEAPPAHATSGTTDAAAHSSDAVTSTASAATSDACTLVTEHDASVALGSDPGAGQAVTSHGASSCMYGASPTLVTVNLLPTGGRGAYDHARQLVPAGRVVDLAGVGSGAFGVFTGPAADIWFYQGDTMVAIGVITGGATTPPRAGATALAKAAAGRV